MGWFLPTRQVCWLISRTVWWYNSVDGRICHPSSRWCLSGCTTPQWRGWRWKFNVQPWNLLISSRCSRKIISSHNGDKGKVCEGYTSQDLLGDYLVMGWYVMSGSNLKPFCTRTQCSSPRRSPNFHNSVLCGILSLTCCRRRISQVTECMPGVQNRITLDKHL